MKKNIWIFSTTYLGKKGSQIHKRDDLKYKSPVEQIEAISDVVFKYRTKTIIQIQCLNAPLK